MRGLPIRRLISAVLPILLSAMPASAQLPPTAPPIVVPGQPLATIVAEPVALMIAACDADRDARVTTAELVVCIATSFAGVTGSAGGAIGYIGYSDWALQWLGDQSALPSPFTVDADSDNRITLAEMQAQFATLFARFDVNRDGIATRAELLTIKSGLRAPEPGGKRGRKGAPPPQ